VRLLYRVRTSGLEVTFPDRRRCCSSPNHISYVDPGVLQLASRGRSVVLGSAALMRNAFFNWGFDVSGVMSGSPRHPAARGECGWR